jgi:hypothetical protein
MLLLQQILTFFFFWVNVSMLFLLECWMLF